MRYIIISILVSLSMLCSCGNNNCEDDGYAPGVIDSLPARREIEVRFDEIDNVPQKKIFALAQDKKNVFIIVSKVHPVHLNVYETVGTDTLLLASYPACVAKNYGQKQRKGDNRTPESSLSQPFYICQIQDSSNWTHDFKDGRGSIPSYGNWFLRLATPGFSGIGIHGSTNNRESVKTGRGSEGCIRLLDEDIVHLKENYIAQGIKVVILAEGQRPLPFEERAMLKTGAFKMIERTDTVPAPVDSSALAPKDSLVAPDEALPAPDVLPGQNVRPGQDENPDREAVPAENAPAEKARPAQKQNPDREVSSAGKASPAAAREKRFSSDDIEIAVPRKEEKTYPDKVTVSGSRQRLRKGGATGEIYSKSNGEAICPRDGEVLECLGEEGNYFKVRFNGRELYINKKSVK